MTTLTDLSCKRNNFLTQTKEKRTNEMNLMWRNKLEFVNDFLDASSSPLTTMTSLKIVTVCLLYMCTHINIFFQVKSDFWVGPPSLSCIGMRWTLPNLTQRPGGFRRSMTLLSGMDCKQRRIQVSKALGELQGFFIHA